MRKLLIPLLIAVIAIGSVAGLGLSGHFSPTTTTTTPVYVGYLATAGSGINSTTAWGATKNIGNGTATLLYHFVRTQTGTVIGNQTDTVQLAPGATLTLTIQGNFQPGTIYQFAIIGGSDCGSACGLVYSLEY